MLVGALAFLVAWLQLPIADDADAYVMGADNRRPLSADERWKFQSVGVVAAKWSLEDRLRPIGTGVIVGSGQAAHDVVVTTAHNFVNHLTGRPHGNEFYFVTNRGEAVRITAARLGRGFSTKGRPSVRDATRDWAAALLETRISGRYGALGVGVIDKQGLALSRKARSPVLAIGYNPETRDLLISDRCSAIALRDRIGLIHDCDTKPGWSGGPLILLDGGKPWVIGISSLQVTEKGKRRRAFDPKRHFNVAAPIGQHLRDAILEAGATGRLTGRHVLTFSPR